MAMNPRLLVPRATFDPDAAAYLRAVEAADGQALETPVKRAVDDFFRGTKADGIWDAIKASCILCGARTLAGALVPLVGTAPTNVADGFVEGDYTRGGATPGLKGDGTSYLDSGRDSDQDPSDDRHISVYETATHSDGANFGVSIGGIDTVAPSQIAIVYRTSPLQLLGRMNDTGASSFARASTVVGFTGVSRASSTTRVLRYGGSNNNLSNITVPMANRNLAVFCQDNGTGVQNFSNGRIAFYSIGTAISDLALLDTRVTALVTSIGAAV